MDSFPYDSWDEAIEAGTGYFTFGPGGNTGAVVLVILAIALAVLWMIQITRAETAKLQENEARLAEKWGGS